MHEIFCLKFFLFLIKLRSFFLKNLKMIQPYKSFKMQQNLRFHYWFWEIIVLVNPPLSILWLAMNYYQLVTTLQLQRLFRLRSVLRTG